MNFFDEDIDLSGCKARIISYSTSFDEIRFELSVLHNQELHNLLQVLAGMTVLPPGSVGSVLGGADVRMTVKCSVFQIRRLIGG